LILAAIGAGVVWGLLVAVAGHIAARGDEDARRLRRAASVAAALVVLVPVAGALIRASSIENTVRTQWHAFVNVAETPATSSADATSTRLFSGSGNRYDYWRIAWSVFKAHPLAGVGAGGYTEPYFRQRHTTEAVQNPHSIELQILAELGLVGAALFAILLAGIVMGGARMRTAARAAAGARTAMVASTGAVVVWLVDTSGDWMHLLPGVTAIAIAGMAVLCSAPAHADAHPGTSGPEAPSRRARTLVGAAIMAFILAVAGASLLRSGLARRYLDDARAELRQNPAAAISDASSSLRLDSANLDAYYVTAAGLARFNRAAAARDVLLAAIRQNPDNFVTWTLLGDLEVRAGNLSAAMRAYRHALALDPRDPAVAALAADPKSALHGSSH
jgi:hypothetical protein